MSVCVHIRPTNNSNQPTRTSAPVRKTIYRIHSTSSLYCLSHQQILTSKHAQVHKPTTGIDLLWAPQLFDLHSMHSMTNSGRKTNTWIQIFTPAAPLQSFPPVIPRFPPEAYSAFRSGAPKLSSSGGFHIGGSESWRGLVLRGSRGQNVDKANNKFLQEKEEGFVVDPHFHPQSLKEWTDPDCGLEAISIVPTKQ